MQLSQCCSLTVRGELVEPPVSQTHKTLNSLVPRVNRYHASPTTCRYRHARTNHPRRSFRLAVRKGCDSCCRRLADVPQLTLAEWELLREGLTGCRRNDSMKSAATCALPPAFAPRRLPAADLATAPVLSIPSAGACRTYGFYVQRRPGTYCHDIESRVAMVLWQDWCGAITMPSIAGSPALAKSAL